MSTVRPSAAIDAMVSHVTATFEASATASLTAPADRSAASTTKPSTNHGTSVLNDKRADDTRWARSAKNVTTGPSINTRASFTTVATCPLTALTANAAASTCGTE